MEYRLLTAEEKNQFLEGWELAFNRKLPRQVYDWIFNDSNNLFAVLENNKVVAGYCLLHCRGIYGAQEVDFALCNNVFVVPEYEGRNLFVRLGRYALQWAEDNGYSLTYGMPNAQSLPGHKRVGWSIQDDILFYELSSTALPPEVPFSDHDVVEISNNSFDLIGDQLNGFSRIVAKERNFSVLKDRSYFKWRYLDRPDNNYKVFAAFDAKKTLSGYVVCKYFEPKNCLHIIDLEAIDSSVLKHLVLSTVNSYEGWDFVNIWGSSAYIDDLVLLGFTRSEELDHFILIEPYKKKHKIQLSGNLNVVLGDNDVY